MFVVYCNYQFLSELLPYAIASWGKCIMVTKLSISISMVKAMNHVYYTDLRTYLNNHMISKITELKVRARQKRTIKYFLLTHVGSYNGHDPRLCWTFPCAIYRSRKPPYQIGEALQPSPARSVSVTGQTDSYYNFDTSTWPTA